MSRDDNLRAALRELNSAMDADRDKRAADALAAYERGIEQLLALRATEQDPEQRKWLEANIKRHLTRAEKLKAMCSAQQELGAPRESLPPHRQAYYAYKDARDALAASEIEKARSLFEVAKVTIQQALASNLLGDDNGVTLREALADCSIQIERLRAYEAQDGKYHIPMGGDGITPYKDPLPPPTLTDKLRAMKDSVTDKFK